MVLERYTPGSGDEFRPRKSTTIDIAGFMPAKDSVQTIIQAGEQEPGQGTRQPVTDNTLGGRYIDPRDLFPFPFESPSGSAAVIKQSYESNGQQSLPQSTDHVKRAAFSAVLGSATGAVIFNAAVHTGVAIGAAALGPFLIAGLAIGAGIYGGAQAINHFRNKNKQQKPSVLPSLN